MIKIISHKEKNSDQWSIKLEKLNENGLVIKQTYEVEFFVDNVVIDEGYSSWRTGHHEPATVVSYITIEHIYLEIEDDIKEINLIDEEYDLLNKYITDNYE